MAATMEASPSRRRSNGPVLGSMSPPSGSSWSSATSPFSSTFASSSSSFSSLPSSGFFRRSSSPTRVSLYSSSSSPSVRFSIDRSVSPSRSITVTSPRDHVVRATKKTCMCSPTTHPGSFRCSLHKNSNHSNNSNYAASYSSNRLNARRSAMTNSLVRLTVEGDWVKRALAALIRPSSHQQRRRTSFQPRPSRLSIMSKAKDDL